MDKTPDKRRSGDSQSIARAVSVLRAIAARPGSSLGEIAKETGLARSTVQRLVGSLSSEGLAAKTFGQQGVYLGMELARLGAKVNLDARALLRPFMQEMHAKIGDNIDLTTLTAERVTVIDQIASNEDIRVVSYVGRHHPINCTANGKAHLAMLDEADARALLATQPLVGHTPQTLIDADVLMTEINAARETGLYTDREEFALDACAVAAALPEINGRHYAVSIAMPAKRFARREDDVRDALFRFRTAVADTYGRSI